MLSGVRVVFAAGMGVCCIAGFSGVGGASLSGVGVGVESGLHDWFSGAEVLLLSGVCVGVESVLSGV